MQLNKNRFIDFSAIAALVVVLVPGTDISLPALSFVLGTVSLGLGVLARVVGHPLHTSVAFTLLWLAVSVSAVGERVDAWSPYATWALVLALGSAWSASVGDGEAGS